MSEAEIHTSLARQLEEAGMSKTPLAKAIAEAVASWLGTNHTDSKLLNALQSTKEWAAEVLSSWPTNIDTNNSLINDPMSNRKTAANDEKFKMAA